MINPVSARQRDGSTLFCLGPHTPSLTVLQGRKQCAWLYDEGRLVEVPFSQILFEDGLYYFSLQITGLHGAHELCSTLRPKAMALIAAFLKGALELSSRLSLVGGMVGFSSFWFTDEGQVLFLSDQMSRLVMDSLDDQGRFYDQTCWLVPQAQEKHKLSYQAVELMYFALSGKPPLLSDNVRLGGYRIESLSRMQCTSAVDLKETLGYIDHMLSFNAKSLELQPSQVLETMQSLPWPSETGTILLPTQRSEKASQALSRRASARSFFRKKGTLIAVIAVVAIALAAFLTSYIKRAVAPPATAGMDEAGIIQSYYDGQSELNVEKLEDSLVKGLHSPSFYEVTSLFVTRQMRQGYENVSGITDARAWLAGGQGPIASATTIYGPGEVSIERADDGSCLARYLFYTTFDYEDDSSEAEEIMPAEQKSSLTLYVYDQIDRFTFTRPKNKDYLLIASIDTVSQKKVDVIEVPYN